MSILNMEAPVPEEYHYEVLKEIAEDIKGTLSNHEEQWALAGLRVGYLEPPEGNEEPGQWYRIAFGTLDAIDNVQEKPIKSEDDWQRFIDDWERAFNEGNVPLDKGFMDYLYEKARGQFEEYTGPGLLIDVSSVVVRGNSYIAMGTSCTCTNPPTYKKYSFGTSGGCPGPCW